MDYTPQQIADASGVCARTVREYLLEKFGGDTPRHYLGEWWKLNEDEYEFVVGQLRAGRSVGTGQPLRELRRCNMLLPLF